MTETRLSIVLPCYNESGNIPGVLEQFRSAISGRSGVELILVDNGSSDLTHELLHQHLKRPENSFATAVRVPVNKGYGYGIMQGVRAAHGEFIAWTHADMQTSAADVLAAYDVAASYAGQKVVIKGRRRKRPLLDSAFTSVMGLISSAALNQRLTDVNAQPKIFPRAFLPLLDRSPDDFSLDLYFLFAAGAHDWRILEYPVWFVKRLHGEAKGGGSWKGRIALIRRTLSFILVLRKETRTGER